MDANLLTLGREQLKDRDQVARIDAINNRLTEDIKALVGNI